MEPPTPPEVMHQRCQTPEIDSSPESSHIILKYKQLSRTNIHLKEDELQKLEGIVEHPESGESGSLSSGESFREIQQVPQTAVKNRAVLISRDSFLDLGLDVKEPNTATQVKPQRSSLNLRMQPRSRPSQMSYKEAMSGEGM